MRVCVTGATGFLGAHLTAKLVRAGHEVRVTVRDRRRLEALKGLDVEAVNADILDRRIAAAGPPWLRHALPCGRNGGIPAGASGLARECRRAPDRGRGGCRGGSAAGDRDLERGRGRAGARGRPADERQTYPQAGTGMLYPDAKHEGELAALDGRAAGRCRCRGRLPLLRTRARLQPLAAGRDLDPDRRQLPARAAAGDRRLLHEHRRRRGRRGGPPAGRPARRAGRAVHPRRREPALVRGDRADNPAVGNPSPAGRPAARAREHRRGAAASCLCRRACSRASA